MKMNEKWSEIFEQYAARFKENDEGRSIGIEKEFPVVDAKTGFAFDVRSIFPDLIADGGKADYDPFYGDSILGVNYKGVYVTTDAGWGTLELPSVPTKSIAETEANFNEWMGFLGDLIGEKGGKILGYGIQPLQSINPENWVKKRRHEVVCRTFGCVHDKNITVTSSDQNHLSVSVDEAVRVNRVMNFLSGPMIAMFANSPIWEGEVDSARLAPREHMWWFTQKNRHGVFTKNLVAETGKRSLYKYFSHMMSMQHLVSQNCRDFFVPGASFKEFIDSQVDFEAAFWREIPTLEGTNWVNARLRSVYGTVEVRPACQQPRESAMALAAFTLGIAENLEVAEKSIEMFNCDMNDAEELREIAMTRGLKARYHGLENNFSMSEMCAWFLKISESGLQKRNLGEEYYLQELWRRVKTETTLAEELIAIFRKDGIHALIERVAYN